MKTTLTILAALVLCVGCSTWTPQKTVTLRDVEPELAQTEGSDLRYLLADPVECEGMECRNLTSKGVSLEVYHWHALCDGQFCDSVELEYVAYVREAAEIAFIAEQMVAARKILAMNDSTPLEQERLRAFITIREENIIARLQLAESGLQRMASDREFAKLINRPARIAELSAAWSYLQRSRELLGLPPRAAHDPFAKRSIASR